MRTHARKAWLARATGPEPAIGGGGGVRVCVCVCVCVGGGGSRLTTVHRAHHFVAKRLEYFAHQHVGDAAVVDEQDLQWKRGGSSCQSSR